MGRLRSLLATLAFLAVAPPSARADEPAPATNAEDRAAAAKEFAEGQRAFAAGDYRFAAEQFEAAYKHKPHYSAIWNAARARQRAGDMARAANLYARYLREAPPSTRDRNTAQTALRQLAPKLGQLELNAAGLEEVKVDREPVADLGSTFYVNPGAHVVEGKSPGSDMKSDKAITQSVVVDAGQIVSVALVPASEAPLPVAPTPAPAPAPAPAPSAVKPPEEKDERRGGWPPLVVYVGAGLTAVAAGFTVISGLDVNSQKGAFDKDPSQANLDAGKSKELRTNILLGVTAALGVFTGISAIWLVDWRGADRSRAQVGLGFGQVSVKGTF
jgi:hypothetical protein